MPTAATVGRWSPCWWLARRLRAAASVCYLSAVITRRCWCAATPPIHLPQYRRWLFCYRPLRFFYPFYLIPGLVPADTAWNSLSSAFSLLLLFTTWMKTRLLFVSVFFFFVTLKTCFACESVNKFCRFTSVCLNSSVSQ